MKHTFFKYHTSPLRYHPSITDLTNITLWQCAKGLDINEIVKQLALELRIDGYDVILISDLNKFPLFKDGRLPEDYGIEFISDKTSYIECVQYLNERLAYPGDVTVLMIVTEKPITSFSRRNYNSLRCLVNESDDYLKTIFIQPIDSVTDILRDNVDYLQYLEESKDISYSFSIKTMYNGGNPLSNFPVRNVKRVQDPLLPYRMVTIIP